MSPTVAPFAGTCAMNTVVGRSARGFLSFLLVGGITAGVNFGLLAIALEVLRLEYRLSVSVAYAGALSFQFLANRGVTFKAARGDPRVQLVRFLLLAGANYLLTLAMVTIGVGLFGISVYAAVFVSLLITTPLGFVLSKRWVFGTYAT